MNRSSRAIGAGLILALGFVSVTWGADDRTPGRVFRDCPSCPELVVIAPGTFTMGSDKMNAMKGGESRPEGPARQVTIAKAFAAGRFETTNAEFRAFVAATGHVSRRHCSVGMGQTKFEAIDFEGPLFGRRPADREAVVCVSWNDAKAYAAWLSRTTGKRYRLLTEAEWEFVAHAGARTRFPWGDDELGACKYENAYDLDSEAAVPPGASITWPALQCRDGQGRIAEVGSYPPNAFGLHDVLGNVWEWVEDCSLERYPAEPTDGSAVEVAGNCEKRAVRGGSWYSRQERHRPPFRGRDPADKQTHHFGMRIARDLD